MKNKVNHIAKRWEVHVFKISIGLLILSGLAQMPLFKRYYIADIPGMAWTADYHFNHYLHYIAAAILLFIVLKWSALFIKDRKQGVSLTMNGYIRAGLFLAIIITGFLRAAKNLPDVFFSPLATTSIIWIHLAAGALLCVAAIYARLAAKSYLNQ